jgi:hypothetical protein
MDRLLPEAAGDKNEYLKDLLFEYVPDRVYKLARRPTKARALKIVFIFVFTAAVGFGYLYALLTPDLVEKANA